MSETVADQDSASTEDDGPRDLSDVLDRVEAAADDHADEEQTVTLGEVVDRIGSRAHGPLLLVPAAIALFPLTGSIPGASVVTGTWIILVAVQTVFSAKSIWLPGFLANRGLSAKKVKKVTTSVRPWVTWVENVVSARLTWLTGAWGTRVVAVVCIGLAVTMYPLALLPGAVAAPSAAICLLAVGITAGDGLILLVGLGGSLAAALGTWVLLT